MTSCLEAALELHGAGINVVAAPLGKKHPAGRWGDLQQAHQTERDVHDRFGGGRRLNVFALTGSVSRLLVLDTDDEQAVGFWRGRLGPVMDATTRVRTGKGWHYYFRLPEGVKVRGRQGEGWDIKAEGGGVIAPPSVHESGREYAWVDGHGLDALQDAPAALLDDAHEASPGAVVDSNGAQAGDGPTGGLAALLAAPPQEGGRNVWLASVAGHYARYLPDYAAYERHVRLAAALLESPLPEEEVAKLLPSIWSAGNRRFEQAVEQREFVLRVNEEARARQRAMEFRPPEVAASFAEVMARPAPEVAWAVEELAGRDHNVLLAAQYKAGKTTLILNLVRAMVDGEPFLGRFETHLAGQVCVLNYELTDQDAQAWITDIGFRRPERALLVGLRGQPNPLATPEGQQWLADLLVENEVELLIVDTFRAAYTGESHNDNAQVARFTRLLDELKARAGVPGLVMSHHFGRKLHEEGHEHGQGAVELDNWADMRWLLTVAPDLSRYLRVDGRGPGLDESQLSFEESSRTLRLPESKVGVDRAAARESDAEATVLLTVRLHPGVNSRELAERAKGNKGDLSKALLKLCHEGRIVVVEGPNRSKLHYLPDDVPAQTSLEGAP